MIMPRITAALLLALGLPTALMLLPLPLHAEPSLACINAAGVVDEAAERLANMDRSRTAPRMAVVTVGSAAMFADAYARDDGWPDDARAILQSLGAAREADEEGNYLSNDETPAFLFEQAVALTEMLAIVCPDTEVASLAGLEPAEGDNP